EHLCNGQPGRASSWRISATIAAAAARFRPVSLRPSSGGLLKRKFAHDLQRVRHVYCLMLGTVWRNDLYVSVRFCGAVRHSTQFVSVLGGELLHLFLAQSDSSHPISICWRSMSSKSPSISPVASAALYSISKGFPSIVP